VTIDKLIRLLLFATPATPRIGGCHHGQHHHDDN
jgi:hypothetical protein